MRSKLPSCEWYSKRVNYVSHHLVARREKPDASAWFYVGNVLPDLLPSSGDGRIRGGDVLTLPDDLNRAELVDGARLHQETDRQFHGLPAFKEACAEVSLRLRAVAWQTPPTRVFFLAHALVEIGIDGWIVQTQSDIANDLYRQLEAVGSVPLSTAATAWLGRPLPRFPVYLASFFRSRFLLSYATAEGQATALRNVCRRAGMPNFENAADFLRFVMVCEKAAPYLANVAPALLNVPAPVVK